MTVKNNGEKLNAMTVLSPNLRKFVELLDGGSDLIKWERLKKDGLKSADGSFFEIKQTLRTASEQVDCYLKGREGVKYDRQIFLFPSDRVKKTPATLFKLVNRGTVKNYKKIVTNAWAGESYHNWGLALDIVLNKLQYAESHKFSDGDMSIANYYKMIGLVDLAKSCGLSWGGDWANILDIWHFEDNSYNLPSQEYWCNTNMHFSFVEEYNNTNKLPAVFEDSGNSGKLKSLLPLCIGLFGVSKILLKRGRK